MTQPTTREGLALALWGKTLSNLTGSPWEDEDVENAADGHPEEAEALQYAYYEMSESEDGVQAALRAAREVFGNFFTVEQFRDLVDGYQVSYTDMEEALQAHLDDHFGKDELQASWFKEGAPIWDSVVRDSEVWATNKADDDSFEGTQYVFTRPGHTL